METLVRGASAKSSASTVGITEKRTTGGWSACPWRRDRNDPAWLAVYEMSELQTPAPVVIDERVELARQFRGRIRVFINGAFDAVHRGAR
jgi:hypothetical protein